MRLSITVVRQYLRGLMIVMTLPVFIMSNTVSAFGLSAEQKSIFDKGILHFDVGTSNDCRSLSSATANRRLASGSEVYVLGDSITASAKDEYEGAFIDQGIVAIVSASDSRSITSPGSDGLSGLEAIAADSAKVSRSEVKAIVVALGSNGHNSADRVSSVFSALRGLNKEAKIYWVDTIAIGRADYQTETIKESNVGIYTEAKNNTITPIPWFKTVDPSGNPESPTGLETDNNQYIVNANQHVHLTAVGTDALVELVSRTVINNASDSSHTVVANGCSCSVEVATGLNGNDNFEKTWNYFSGKGLAPNAIAGMMGNLMAESGINPQNIQRGAPFPDGPELPTEIDKVTGGLAPDSSIAGSYGYGIMQWTTVSRQQGLIETSKRLDKFTGDLEVQLEHIWGELQTKYFDDVLAKLREPTVSLNDASDKVALDYATPRAVIFDPNLSPDTNEARRNGAFNVRRKFSTEILEKYSRFSSGSVFSGSTGSCATITGPGDDTKYVEGFTIYSQIDKAWKDKPYGSSTIGYSGCGPSAMSMIITNLTGSVVSPLETTDYSNELNMYIDGKGSSWEVAPKLASHWGLKSQKIIKKDVATITAALQAGYLIIGAGGGAKPFTDEGHYIIIRGVTSGGKFKIADSYHKDTAEQEWDATQILEPMSLGSMYAITK